MTRSVDPLKFISDIDTRAKSLSGDRTRRTFDAVDEFRTENARLTRELAEAREEIQRLKQQLEQRAAPAVAPKTPVPVATPKPVESIAPEEDPTRIRFSMLELD